MKIPEKGDIIVLDFSPSVGHEQGGTRPALVISDVKFNERGMVFVCPITSTERGHFFETKLDTTKTKGVVLSFQLRSMDFRARKAKIVDRVDASTLEEVIDKVKILLS